MSQLAAKIASCTLCADKLPNPAKPILQFHRQAKILIAGQAPGAQAHQTGIPFSDQSGQRLRAWLGVTNEVFYGPEFAILPMGFCYPGRGKSGDLAPRLECQTHWRKALLAQLSDVKLTLILGQYALKYHLPDTTGTLTEKVKAGLQANVQTLVLPHPSPRNNFWLKRHPWFEQDLLPKLQQHVAQILYPEKTSGV